MNQLDDRKIRILEAVVNDYVSTSKPVGSERLIGVYTLGCKSATVRNEMADLAEMGYLVQPHTSAGRIPTDQGYRYYVDELMKPPSALRPEEVARARASCARARAEVDEILSSTCRVLSQLTSCASMASEPSTTASTVRRVYLSGASPRHALLVVLLSTGHVQNRLIEVSPVPGDRSLAALSAFVNLHVAGQPIAELGRMRPADDLPPELAGSATLLARVFVALADVADALAEDRVLVEGTHQFLRQPEFQDVQRLESLLNVLEQRSALFQVLRRTMLHRSVTIHIGAENEYEPMQECSVVSSSYRISGRPAGYLGVVGPTRMNYERAAAAVDLMARSLSQVLTNLSLA